MFLYNIFLMQLDPSATISTGPIFSPKKQYVYLFFTIMIGYLHVDVVYAAQDFKDLCLYYL